MGALLREFSGRWAVGAGVLFFFLVGWGVRNGFCWPQCGLFSLVCIVVSFLVWFWLAFLDFFVLFLVSLWGRPVSFWSFVGGC